MAKALTFIATTSRGLEQILTQELRSHGLQRVHPERGAVRFMGKLKDGYRACLYSRVASRVLLRVHRFTGTTADHLYDGIRSIDWSQHFDVDNTFAIRFHGTNQHLRDSRFATFVVKDAIVDQFRDRIGERPDIDPKRPDVALHIHCKDGTFTALIDLSGSALHLRGGMRRAGPAPLRETVAAAMLIHAGWPAKAREGRPLLDPMCGSGTLLLEAADMARNFPPGLRRNHWGFSRWKQHQPEVWRALYNEAKANVLPLESIPPIVGRDRSRHIIHLAEDNADALGLSEAIQFSTGDVSKARPFKAASTVPHGIVVVNPPYGERLEEEDAAKETHALLGKTLKAHFVGWEAWVFTTTKAMVRALGLKSRDTLELFNGPLRCRVSGFDVLDKPPKSRRPPKVKPEPAPED